MVVAVAVLLPAVTRHSTLCCQCWLRLALIGLGLRRLRRN